MSVATPSSPTASGQGLSRHTLLRRAGQTTVGLAALVATGSLAACGASEKPAASAGPVTLQHYMWGDAATAAVDTKMLDALKAKQPRITVQSTVVPAYNDYYDKLQAQVVGGSPPDVAMVNVLLFATVYSQGILQDLTPLIQKTKRKVEDYWPSQMAGLRHDGKVWAFGRDFSPRLFFLNRTMLAKSGQQIDEQKWTWDEFVRITTAMTQGEGASKQWGTTAGDFLTWLYSAGGAVYNPEGTKVVTDTAEAVRGIEFRGDLVTKHRVTPQSSEMGGRSEIQLFTDGRIGLYMTGRWNYPTMNNIKDFDWDVVLPPTGPGGRWTNGGGGGYAILKGAKQTDAAWDVLAWITGEGQKDVADVIGIPAYKPATEAPAFRVSKPANDKAFITLAEKHTKLQPQHPKHTDVDKIITAELGKVNRGEQSARDAGRQIAEQGTPLVQGTPWKAPA
ncbi:MAG TPA: sugar ABC transporter substrate-binding protein [Chloroflexota bacterium]|nr:sugar ABC transporter substrate-binding protein [Chloroflexota bacterium]